MAEKSGSAVVRLDSLLTAKGDRAEAGLVRAFAEGLLLGAYKFDKHKSAAKSDGKAKKNKAHGPAKITFVTKDKKLSQVIAAELALVQATAEAMRVTRDWSNEPSNIGTPEFYANDAKKLAKEYGLKCTILTEEDAAKEKMGLFLAVGQGAEREGRIVVLEYTPKGKQRSQTQNDRVCWQRRYF